MMPSQDLTDLGKENVWHSGIGGDPVLPCRSHQGNVLHSGSSGAVSSPGRSR